MATTICVVWRQDIIYLIALFGYESMVRMINYVAVGECCG